MRLGYQISVDVLAHRANMAEHREPEPVIVLSEIVTDDVVGWQRNVHQVKLLGPARSEYGWGPERAHARGARGGASIWVFTESPVEYLDADHVWKTAH